MQSETRPSGTRPRNPQSGSAPPARPAGKAQTTLGVSPEELAAAAAAANAGAGFADPDDPKVFIGGSDDPLSVVNMKFYGLSPAQLREFQARAYGAGLYRGEKPRYGDYDDQSFSVWSGLNERAAKFYANGKRFTPSMVLDMATANAPVADEELKMGSSGRPGFVDAVTNKVDLEAQIQQAARGKLNRKLNPKEVAKFVAVYQGMQRQSFAQQNAASLAADGQPGAPGVDGAPGRSTTLVAPVGPDAAADQFLDAGFAQEAAGVSALGAFGVIERLLAGGQ